MSTARTFTPRQQRHLLRVYADGLAPRFRTKIRANEAQESRLAFRYIMIAAGLLAIAAPGTGKPPTTWDGLVQVPAKRISLAYLQPGADFRAYTKVFIDPTEVSFHKDWQRDFNRDNRSLAGRISNADVQDAIVQGVKAANDIFAAAWTRGGYTVVNAPGPDVLRVKTGVLNIRVSAPDRQTPGRSMSFAEQAGSAALFVEARDSMSGALLGRAIDQKVVGDTQALWRTSASNRADFREAVEQWAAATVRGISELKARSPVRP